MPVLQILIIACTGPLTTPTSAARVRLAGASAAVSLPRTRNAWRCCGRVGVDLEKLPPRASTTPHAGGRALGRGPTDRRASAEAKPNLRLPARLPARLIHVHSSGRSVYRAPNVRCRPLMFSEPRRAMPSSSSRAGTCRASTPLTTHPGIAKVPGRAEPAAQRRLRGAGAEKW